MRTLPPHQVRARRQGRPYAVRTHDQPASGQAQAKQSHMDRADRARCLPNRAGDGPNQDETTTRPSDRSRPISISLIVTSDLHPLPMHLVATVTLL